MARTLLTALLTLLTLTACAPTRFVDEGVACRDRRITLIHGLGHMTVVPPYVEVCRNTTLHVNLAPPVPVGLARTFPGDGQPEWLNRANVTTREILVDIPEDAVVDDLYKYGVAIEDVGQLDPYVRIIF